MSDKQFPWARMYELKYPLQPDENAKTMQQAPSAALAELADGAIDTLGCVIQTMGAASFPA